MMNLTLSTAIAITITLSFAATASAQSQSFEQVRAENEEAFRKMEFEHRKKMQEFEEAYRSSTKTQTRPTMIHSSAQPPSMLIRKSPAKAAGEFIHRVNSAGSLNQVLGVMSARRNTDLKQREQQYSPQNSHDRRQQMERVYGRRLTTEEALELTSSPFANELRSLKAICANVISFTSQTMDGSSSTVTVWRHNRANGDGDYPYGTGVFRFVAENGSWRFESYQDTDMFYGSMSE